MKVNFKAVQVKDIEGKIVLRDFSKEIGNTIFNTTKDLGELELAREIYKNGEVELNKDQAQMIKAHVQQNYLAWAQDSILPLLEVKNNIKK